MNNLYIRRLTTVSLFSVLIIVGTFITVPVAGVPFTLQTFSVVLVSLLLGPVYGTLSILLYISLIIIGMPVASGGRGGPQVILGPTGGFIVGFILTSIIAGLGSRFINLEVKNSIILLNISSIVAILSVYLIGLPWYAFVAEISIKDAAISMSFFYIFDILKAIFATMIYDSVRKRIDISDYIN